MPAVPLSLLDLAHVGRDETVREALDASVRLAQRSEALGFRRVWYAEHHNMPSIASSATAVLIAHVAAHTETIRLGAGGVMLPNHAPLVIAEQFGTLATLHPGRIELGLGRAPGTDPGTTRALRRDAAAADTFPQDVLELQGFLRGASRIPGVRAIPGDGTDVPLFLLGSSLFGAQLAAKLGLPYAFASHFAPAALHQAVRVYREHFEPSEQLAHPTVLAGVNVVLDDSEEAAQAQLARRRRALARSLLLRRQGPRLSDEEVDAVLATPQGAHVDQMLTYTVVGTAETVGDGLEAFLEHAGADELVVALQGDDGAARLRALEGVAQATGQAAGGGARVAAER